MTARSVVTCVHVLTCCFHYHVHVLVCAQSRIYAGALYATTHVHMATIVYVHVLSIPTFHSFTLKLTHSVHTVTHNHTHTYHTVYSRPHMLSPSCQRSPLHPFSGAGVRCGQAAEEEGVCWKWHWGQAQRDAGWSSSLRPCRRPSPASRHLRLSKAVLPALIPRKQLRILRNAWRTAPPLVTAPPPQLMGFMLEPLGNPGAEIPKSHPHYGMYWGEHRLRTECS